MAAATHASCRRSIVISGPSGVGKSTLCQRLLDAHPKAFATTVSHTTRKPRPGELEGTTYYYVERAKFESLIKEDAFLEYTEFNNLYGTSKQTILDQMAKGSAILLDVEMEGVKQPKELQSMSATLPNLRFVFIKPPDYQALQARLRERGTEDKRSIQKRLDRARVELDYAETGVRDRIIINQDLELAYQEPEEFIFRE